MGKAVFILLVILFAGQLRAAPGPVAAGPYATWAVVASPGVQEMGLADLVLAGLSQEKSIRLVERDQVGAADRELAVASSLATDPAGRLALGRRLGADALVLLTEQQIGGARVIRLAVSECRCGARLSILQLPATPAQMPKLAEEIVAEVLHTRTRFADGVRWVIGVPHFVSHSLTHERDDLQASYAALVESALEAVPGVAVIETEEAHQIRAEQQTAGGDLALRMVPLFIEGEYQTTRPDAQHPATLDLLIKVSRSDGDVLTIRREGLSLAQGTEVMAKGLADDLRREVLRIPPGAGPGALSPEQQFDRLVAKAQAFARVGAWEHSTGLREAALLLKPDSVEQRRAAAEEHLQLVSPPVTPDRPFIADPVARENRLRECQQHWQIGLDHLEHLIRARQIGAADAERLSVAAIQSFRRRKTPAGAEGDAIRQRFLNDVYPLILSLPIEPQKAEGLRAAWLRDLVSLAGPSTQAADALAYYPPEEALQVLGDLLVTIVPEDLWPTRSLVRLLQEEGMAEHEKAMGRFMARLERSGHPIMSESGKYGRWYRAWRQARQSPLQEGWAEVGRGILAEMPALRKPQMKEIGPNTFARVPDELTPAVEGLRREIRSVLAAATAKDDSPSAPLIPIRPPPTIVSGIGFEPIVVKVVAASSKGSSEKPAESVFHPDVIARTGFVPYAKDAELVWTRGRIFLHRRKGVFEEVALPEQFINFTDVVWDGGNFWIANGSQGLLLMDTEGRVLQTFGQDDGLLPAEVGMRLFPLGVDRLLVVGSFGEHWRAWCAIVERHGGSIRVNVFHKAMQLPATPSDRNHSAEPTTADAVFQPGPIREINLPADPPRSPRGRLLLVERMSNHAGVNRQPLLIDLATLKVQVAPPLRGSSLPDGICVTSEGHLLAAGPAGFAHYAPSKVAPYLTLQPPLICQEEHRLLSNHLVPYRGSIYAPGEAWYRIDPLTFHAERLTEGRLPREYAGFQQFAESVHFGLLAWGWQVPGYAQAQSDFQVVQPGAGKEAPGK